MHIQMGNGWLLAALGLTLLVSLASLAWVVRHARSSAKKAAVTPPSPAALTKAEVSAPQAALVLPRQGAAPALAASAATAPDPVAVPAALPTTVVNRGRGSALISRLRQLLLGNPPIDAALLERLEELLLTADVGVGLTHRLLDSLRAMPQADATAIEDALRQALLTSLQGAAPPPLPPPSADGPRVILFVGVNGAGKTTSIGKVAARLVRGGDQVLLAAGDTFRAAAAEQLEIWGSRSGCRVVRGEPQADPASVIFNGITAARQQGADWVLADTAGRLHTNTELMAELVKVKRAAAKARAGAPDEIWLVLDATTGQNALQQARQFHAGLGLTGLILTKLDGTAKGGVVVAITEALRLPVRYIGIGEQVDDLQPFVPEDFVAALFDPPLAAA